jgi:hypothetical protein
LKLERLRIEFGRARQSATVAQWLERHLGMHCPKRWMSWVRIPPVALHNSQADIRLMVPRGGFALTGFAPPTPRSLLLAGIMSFTTAGVALVP